MKRFTQSIVLSILALAAVGSLSPVQAEFSDLPKTHHHYFPLSYLEFEGVIQGYNDGTVRPEAQINRAELVKILVEGQGLFPDSSHNNCFPDVHDEWFAPYVCFAKQKGWIGGYPDGTFQAVNPVNKAEALKIIFNAYGLSTSNASRAAVFSDVSAQDWYAPYLATAVQKQLIEELGAQTFQASNPRNRGEVAEMVARIKMIQAVGDRSYSSLLRAEFENYLYIHELRRKEGIFSKLKVNPNLWRVAREHAKDMGDNIGALSHTSSDGVTQSYDRIKNVIIAEEDPNFSGRTGENIGGGSVRANPFDTVTYVHDVIFMPEDPNVCNHRTTLLSQCLPFTEIGVGIYKNTAGQVYFVNDFITREYAKVQVGIDNSALTPPPEYSGSAYSFESHEDDYLVVIVRNCQSQRLRLSSSVSDVLVLDRDGACELQERALGSEPRKFPSNQDYSIYGVLSLTYSTVFYGNRDPNSGPYIIVYPQGNWEITSQEAPYYFDLGATATISARNKASGIQKTYFLDFSEEGHVTIDER